MRYPVGSPLPAGAGAGAAMVAPDGEPWWFEQVDAARPTELVNTDYDVKPGLEIDDEWRVYRGTEWIDGGDTIEDAWAAAYRDWESRLCDRCGDQSACPECVG